MITPAPIDLTGGAAATIAAISATLLAILGVDYYSLLWASVAAGAHLLYSDKTNNVRAIFITLSSALIGAALGTAVAELPWMPGSGNRSLLISSSIVCATGARLLVVTLIDAMVSQIRKKAGIDTQPTDSDQSPPHN